MASIFRSFYLIIWKNLLIRKHHWLMTLIELLLPVFLFVLLAIMRAQSPELKAIYVDNATIFPELPMQQLVSAFAISNKRVVAYAPSNSFTDDLMQRVISELDWSRKVLKPCKNELDLEKLFKEKTVGGRVVDINFVGVVFEGDVHEGDNHMPLNFTYKIRLPLGQCCWDTNRLFHPTSRPGPIQGEDEYYRSGFLALQMLLDKAFIEMSTRIEDVPSVSVQRFPYPPFIQDFGVAGLFGMFLPLMTVLSFVMLSPSIIKKIVEEKQTGVQELMKMMGLKPWMMWMGWLVNSLMVNFVPVIVIVVLLKVTFNPESKAVLNYTDPIILWVFLYTYLIAGIVFCFCISAFFNHPTLAMTCGIVLWLTSYFIPGFSLLNSFSSLNAINKFLLALLPNMAMNGGFHIIGELETTGSGLRWNTFFKVEKGVSFAYMFFMLIFDIFLYALITWYVNCIKPGQYGIAKPWYFIFTNFCRKSREPFNRVSSSCDMKNAKYFEEVTEDYPVGIRFKNLRKVFRYFLKEVVAVDDVSLDIYKDEITALLGHNGAGKTTTMSLLTGRSIEPVTEDLQPGIIVRDLRKTWMSCGKKIEALDGLSVDIFANEITALLGHNGAGKTTLLSILVGMFSPTGGTAFVNGYSIRKHMDKVRESIGLCPQHDMLFQELTVNEHLLFFAMLKGVSREKAKAETFTLLKDLNLLDKKYCMPTALSGGMKRKLSLAIALIGGSKVVILDEPTSGMDPESRRRVWDMLQGMRGQRTILISTHFMEEADALGDRIAIMVHGQVFCYGTPMFLKKLYGAGYHLHIVKGSTCSVRSVTDTIKSFIPEGELKQDGRTELSYILPSEQTAKFPELFDHLEINKHQLGISGIGVTITTMDEVFLKVGMLAEEQDRKGFGEILDISEEEDFVTIPAGDSVSVHIATGNKEVLSYSTIASPSKVIADSVVKKETGPALIFKRHKALFVKKMLHTFRNWITLLPQALIAVLMIYLAVILSGQVVETVKDESPRTLALKDYGRSPIEYQVDSGEEELGIAYRDLVKDIADLRLGTSDVVESLIKDGEANLPEYRESYIVAAKITSNGSHPRITALHSTLALHSAPISLNLVMNALLKYLNNKSNYSITTINHPLEKIAFVEYTGNFEKYEIAVMFLWGTLPAVGLLLFVTGFIMFPVTERASRAKQLQLMTGIRPFIYWASSFIWDLVCYLLVICILLSLLPVIDSSGMFKYVNEVGSLLVILLAYGLSGILLTYIISFVRDGTGSAFAAAVIINLVVGIVMMLTVFFLELSAYYVETGSRLRTACQFLAYFPLTYALMHFAKLVVSNNKCNIIPQEVKDYICSNSSRTKDVSCCENLCEARGSCHVTRPYLHWPESTSDEGVGKEVFFLFLDFVIYFAILLLIECGCLTKLRNWIEGKIYRSSAVDDIETCEDVLAEEEKIDEQASRSSDFLQLGPSVLLVQRLGKDYKRFSAVNKVSFRVLRGECFGLLGVNGAGKTTTFNMLTGGIEPTRGNAFMYASNLRNNRRQFLAEIGYCPQFDAIVSVLTGREMLHLFAHFRGIPDNCIHNEIEKWLNLLGLKEYGDKFCGTYSGGNKRKLSTAVALIGDPPIIFLDEPTSGVDPVSRRNLWKVLQQCQCRGQSIVLTSHSMEECEELCNRVAIMVNGKFVCLGSIQYLKNKYGKGYTVTFKLRMGHEQEQVKTLKQVVRRKFGYCILKQEHQNLLEYHIADTELSWSHLFTTIEEIKSNHALIEDYTTNQTTLEQVFLSFAQFQKVHVPPSPNSESPAAAAKG